MGGSVADWRPLATSSLTLHRATVTFAEDSPKGQGLEGRILQNRYRVLSRIGAGAAGSVWKAVDMTLRRKVAVKILHPEKTEKQHLLQRFYREARKASQLSHPNSVTVHDFGRTEDDTFFLVMEYLHGLSLKAVLEREGFIAPGRATYIVKQVCDSLAEAHGLGMIHRDLKPDNIFLTAKGEQCDVVKLVDFGLAKTLGSQTDFVTQQGTPGTPNYMAPEQIAEQKADARSDLYSLGAVVYTILTGTPVFRGKQQLVEVLFAHVNDAPDPMSQRAPERRVPADLEAIVLKLLAKNPDERHQTAAEVKDALASTVVAGTWFDADSRDAWSGYDLAPEDEDESLFDDLGGPAEPEQVVGPPSKVVTMDSTGMRPHAQPTVELPAARRRVPWALLVGVTLGVAVATAAVVWFLAP